MKWAVPGKRATSLEPSPVVAVDGDRTQILLFDPGGPVPTCSEEAVVERGPSACGANARVGDRDRWFWRLAPGLFGKPASANKAWPLVLACLVPGGAHGRRDRSGTSKDSQPVL
jgi:hypothetical protein